MNYCSNCGSELKDGADVCLNCGKQVKQSFNVQNQSVDNSALYGFLGFCIPIVGIVLYFVWQDSKPQEAKAAGLGALIGFVLGFIAIFFSY